MEAMLLLPYYRAVMQNLDIDAVEFVIEIMLLFTALPDVPTCFDYYADTKVESSLILLTVIINLFDSDRKDP